MHLSKIFALAITVSPLAVSATAQIPESAIAQYPCWGTLRESADGFVYLDIDDNYIHQLIHFIEDDGYEEPPYFGQPELVGAHISVVYAKEERVGKIAEEGRVIHFTPLSCRTVQPPNWEGIDRVYMIEVDAPELDLIRANLGLPKFAFGYHITVGIKPL